MKTCTLLIIGCLAIHAECFAQQTINRLNSTASGLNSAANSASNVTNAVGNTTNAIKGTASTVQQLGTLFKKKESTKEVSTSNILIIINGTDYTKLKAIEDAIKPIEGVKSTTKKFSTSGSTIEVNYTGKDDQLWDALPETIKSTLTLTDLGNGKITLEQKQ